MVDQGEYASGSWEPSFFNPPPMENCFLYNMPNGGAPPFLRAVNSAPFIPGMCYLPKTSSSSSLNGVAPQGMAFQRTNSGGSINDMPNRLSRTNSVSSLHDMPFMPGNHHGMSSEPQQNGLQKMSFLIPRPPGPPTLVHMYTLASLNSPAPPQVFGGGNFGLPPQQMAPMFMAREVAGGAAKGGPKGSPLLDEVSRRVLHQVEFYFSDLNVATTVHLIRYMNKDPEGYVPISVIASFKKIRTAISNNAQLSDIIRHSKRLIVSDDGKKVKRVDHLTESSLEALQSRIVVAEDLPEDHCHQTLMMIFSEVGSVNAIRTCPPAVSYGVVSSTSKTEISDGLFHSNKLHSFVEYESAEMAEKAVAELNDVENKTNGLKVHFLKRKVKSSQPKSVKTCRFNDTCGLSTDEPEGDEDAEQKKQQDLGRGKGRERSQPPPPNSRLRMMHTSFSSPNLSALSNHEQHGPIKQALVPRMPDGTKGFSMGRGKMIDARAVRVLSVK